MHKLHICDGQEIGMAHTVSWKMFCQETSMACYSFKEWQTSDVTEYSQLLAGFYENEGYNFVCIKESF